MTVYLVTYDLKKEPVDEARYSAREETVLAVVEGVDRERWRRLTKSCYAIEDNSGSPQSWVQKLKAAADNRIDVCVVTGTHHHDGSWVAPKDDADRKEWLKAHVR